MRADLGIVDRLDPCVNEVNEVNYVPRSTRPPKYVPRRVCEVPKYEGSHAVSGNSIVSFSYGARIWCLLSRIISPASSRIFTSA